MHGEDEILNFNCRPWDLDDNEQTFKLVLLCEHKQDWHLFYSGWVPSSLLGTSYFDKLITNTGQDAHRVKDVKGQWDVIFRCKLSNFFIYSFPTRAIIDLSWPWYLIEKYLGYLFLRNLIPQTRDFLDLKKVDVMHFHNRHHPSKYKYDLDVKTTIASIFKVMLQIGCGCFIWKWVKKLRFLSLNYFVTISVTYYRTWFDVILQLTLFANPVGWVGKINVLFRCTILLIYFQHSVNFLECNV